MDAEDVACTVEIVMNELRKNQSFHFDFQMHPIFLNSTYLHCQMTGFISTYKGPKNLKCRIISLLEEYFLLLNTFYTYVLTCTNFE